MAMSFQTNDTLTNSDMYAFYQTNTSTNRNYKDIVEKLLNDRFHISVSAVRQEDVEKWETEVDSLRNKLKYLVSKAKKSKKTIGLDKGVF